ncbi:MAG: 1,4-dihydroxy-6-naphthoate synthase [Bacteroidetes bacterium]|nr:1,4-dihydroxy-6-naphthoate synthase [Bacteroidota bacterium]
MPLSRNYWKKFKLKRNRILSKEKIIKIGYSPCPNDTFIFDALVHNKIDTRGFQFEPVLEDVEKLNQMAFRNELDVTKLSFHAYAQVNSDYQLLTAGSALGNGVGPLFIARQSSSHPELDFTSVAIPGKNTTANFLFSIFYPNVKVKKEMIFSAIENAVISGETDAGVIIHENRFTYEQKGLVKIADLGELWEKSTGQAIPLGGIAVRRNFPSEIKSQINQLVKESVEFAFKHPDESVDYVCAHAQEMDPSVRQKHIDLYVNQYSIDLGEKGKDAIRLLFSKGKETGMLKAELKDLFVS